MNERTVHPWSGLDLAAVPAFRECPEHACDGVRALFFEGAPRKGKPTRVFAYYGVPDVPEGRRCPAMVLVHGGGGSAFAPWVKRWVERGYAAISMDTCGCVSGGGYQNHPRLPDGGPPGWGGFDQVEEPVEEQWPYHAVAAAVRAHSLLRSLPGVDPERVGLTGVSWGGYLTCLAAGVDPRFRFAAPVYGCGFLRDNSAWLPEFDKMGTGRAARWSGLWDPSVYLPSVARPMLWVTGTNDFAYPMDSLRKSYRLPPGERTLCLRVGMVHDHKTGEAPEEIRVFADSLLAGGAPLARVEGAGEEEGRAWVRFDPAAALERVEFHFTRGAGKWQERVWETRSVPFRGGRAETERPADATAWFFNLVDPHGLVVSSEHGVP